MLHPEVAGRDCQDCCRYVYGPDGQHVKRWGQSQKRDRPPPCEDCPKVPLGHPSPSPYAAVDLDEQGHKAVANYHRRKASRQIIMDEAEAYLAGIIETTEAKCASIKEDQRFAALRVAIIQAAKIGRGRRG